MSLAFYANDMRMCMCIGTENIFILTHHLRSSVIRCNNEMKHFQIALIEIYLTLAMLISSPNWNIV